MLDQIPPHDVDLERQVIGQILSNNGVIPKVLEEINVYDFYKDANKKIFSVIVDLYGSGVAIDLQTLKDGLYKGRLLEAVGGEYYLTTLTENTSSAENIMAHVKILKEKSLYRDLLNIGHETTQDAGIGIKTPEEIIETIEKNIHKHKKYSNCEITTPENYKKRRTNAIVERLNSSVIFSGFNNLDNFLTEGFARKRISCIASRPSMGKTSLKENIIKNLCENGLGVVSISCESDFLGETDKLDSLFLKVPTNEIMQYTKENNRHRDGLINSMDWISKWNYHLVESRGLKLQDTKMIVKDIQKKNKVHVVFIDLFSGLKDVSVSVNKRETVDAKLGEVREIVNELDTHYCLLHHISRAVEIRKDKRPMMSDLRDSGSWEQILDLIILLYREKYYNKNATSDICELILAKQRYGKRDVTAYTQFDPEIGMFWDTRGNLNYADAVDMLDS